MRRYSARIRYTVALIGLAAVAACQSESPAGLVTAPDLPGPVFAAGASGKKAELPQIASLVLQSTTIQIGTPMPYTLALANAGAGQSAVWILGELVQSGKTWAGGTGIQCPDQPFAYLPTGGCTFGFEVDFPEQHTLKPGTATFVLHLLQEDPRTGMDKEFDRVSVRVTLTN
jgi:hypothetical protein